MNEVWIIWCEADSYGRVRSEVVNRLTEDGAPAPRFARVDCPEDVVGLATSMNVESVCVAIEVDEDRLETCENMMGHLAEGGVPKKVVALVRRPDPGVVARCFLAGATEVIAAGDAEGYTETKATRGARDGLIVQRDVSSPAVDDERAPDGEGMDPPWLELDEPDAAEAGYDGGEGSPNVRGGGVACSREDGAVQMPRAVRAPTQERGAPVVTVVSGRGGVGKTTLVASMAACAARTGLRAAVVDLDLMFGNLHEVFGVGDLRGLEALRGQVSGTVVAQDAVERTAMRIGPGLTLWGPCASPEYAELCAGPIEGLVGALRGLADVILIDTPDAWGDAVAMAIASCDRCLVVGGKGASSSTSGRRAVELVARLGVPHTKMTCVFNRLGAKGCGEEEALAFELGTTLRSRVRIADGGEEAASMLSFGCVDGLVAGQGAFARSVRKFTGSLLGELGYPMARKILEEELGREGEDEQRFRLPWHKWAGEVA